MAKNFSCAKCLKRSSKSALRRHDGMLVCRSCTKAEAQGIANAGIDAADGAQQANDGGQEAGGDNGAQVVVDDGDQAAANEDHDAGDDAGDGGQVVGYNDQADASNGNQHVSDEQDADDDEVVTPPIAGPPPNDADEDSVSSQSEDEGPNPSKRRKVTLGFKRLSSNRRTCIFCRSKRMHKYGGDKLVTIPRQAKTFFFIDYAILIPGRAKCCKRHLKDGLIREEVAQLCEAYSNTSDLEAPEIEQIIEDLRKIAKSRQGMDFDSPHKMSDDDYHSLTGLNKEQFDDLFSKISDSLRNINGRSGRTSLAIFLIKLRTGVSHSVLSALFGLPRRTIGRTVSSVRKLLVFAFVPHYLGTNHISREEIIEKHTSPAAKTIFSPDQDHVIVVADATYIYIQKSSNYAFQRRTFSVHKGRSLIKPMIVVSSTGYFIEILGPFLADGKNNDASILAAIMRDQTSGLRNWLKEGDIFLVDRGFRDCLDMLTELGYETQMPAFLNKGSQHTTEDANDSRLKTVLRWVVEADNFLVKTWRLLDHVLPNCQIPYARDYVRIVGALCNAYRPPRISSSPDSVLRAERMVALATQPNALKALVEENSWDRQRVIYQMITDRDLQDFPRLTEEELRNITFGVYQLKQSRSYTLDHLSDDGLYTLAYLRQQQQILRLQIQSRHTSSKQWTLWVKYACGVTPSFEWYCKCKTGARIVGCCAHVASVLWFLGFWRHDATRQVRPINYKAQQAVLDAASLEPSGWTESSDDGSDSE